MDCSDRLKEIRKHLGSSQAEFAEKLGLKQGSYSDIERKRVGVSSHVKNILQKNYNVDLVWLETGTGEKFISSDTIKLMKEVQSECAPEISIAEKSQGVPYYENLEGTCGIIPLFSDYPEAPTFYINYEHFNDCTAYIPIVGDSMYPQYCSGEIIAVKRIYNMDVIQWGEAYFVVTNDNANGLKTVKQVHYCDDDSKIILRASNPNFKGDTVISKEDIVSMFIIKGKIKRYQL